MTIGLRTPLRRNQLAEVAAVHVRKADIEQDAVEIAALDLLQRLGGVGRLRRLELFVQLQLFGQRLTQGGVVVDQQDLLV